MNKQKGQVELKKMISEDTALSQDVVDTFVKELFNEIKKRIIEDSSIKVEGLGLFRIFKSGESNRILFLGSKQNINKSLDIDKFKDDLSQYLDNNILESNTLLEDLYSTTSEAKVSDLSTCIETSDNENDGDIQLRSSKKDHNIKKSGLNSKLLKISIATLCFFATCGIAYLLFKYSPETKKGNDQSVSFIELDLQDTINFSYNVIPELDVTLEYISKSYYGNEVFWPYIYMANESVINNSLEVKAGSIIKIPKLTVDLVELNKGTVMIEAQNIGREIKDSKNEINK